ncbi:MAG: hypothetical protein AAFS10_06310, partial [Myxococcota bacterium]
VVPPTMLSSIQAQAQDCSGVPAAGYACVMAPSGLDQVTQPAGLTDQETYTRAILSLGLDAAQHRRRHNCHEHRHPDGAMWIGA